VICPRTRREEAWRRLARELPQEKLESMTAHAPLSDVPRLAGDILAGKVKGRMVIDVAG
jgi:acrylyl-CoA reductase (NADPH)